MITAVQAMFQRERGAEWEPAIAICMARGMSDVICFVPYDATTWADIPHKCWDYKLFWGDGIVELEQQHIEMVAKMNGHATAMNKLPKRRKAPLSHNETSSEVRGD